MEQHTDVVIIGGGPAGLAAALQAREQGAKVLVLERDKEAGGILQQCIHNGFGLHYFGEELTGPEYAARFLEKVYATHGITVCCDTMVLELTSDRKVIAVNPAHGLMEISAGAVVLAMGCRERTRGALNIPGSRPAGIFTAGCAQRLVNMEGYMPGREVVILGSGDIGLIMARRMVFEGANVKLVAELMPYSSGLNRNIVQCLEDFHIPIRFNHTVVKVHGTERLTAVTLAEVDPATRIPIPGTEEEIVCDTLLLSVGLLPENELTKQAGIAIDTRTSGAIVDENRQTSVPGIFACGNVLHVHDLADHVSYEAEIAGRAAATFSRLENKSFSQSQKETAPPHKIIAEGSVRYTVPQVLSDSACGKLDIYFRVNDVVKPARLTISAEDAVHDEDAITVSDTEPTGGIVSAGATVSNMDIVASGATILVNRKKQIMTPGEMEKVTVDVSNHTGDIHICVEKEG